MRSIRPRDCRLLAARARPSCEKDGNLAALRSSLQTVLEGIVRSFSVSLRGEGREPLGDGEFVHAAGSDKRGCPRGAPLSGADFEGQA
jgi:hypothetical protein